MNRTIIAGSRTITNYHVLKTFVATLSIEIGEVISGGARGVDRLGEIYARDNKIPLSMVRADWNQFGKSAGYRRNVEMARRADVLIALWDGRSAGTKHMIDTAKRFGLQVFVHLVDGPLPARHEAIGNMERPIRGIFIDAQHDLVQEVTVTTIDDACRMIDGYLELVHVEGGDDLFINDGNRPIRLTYGFSLADTATGIFIGNGLILGFDDENGKSIDTTLSVEEVRRRVSFVGGLRA